MSDLTDTLQSSNNLSLVAIFGPKGDLRDHQVPTNIPMKTNKRQLPAQKPWIFEDSAHPNNSLFRNAKDTHTSLC